MLIKSKFRLPEVVIGILLAVCIFAMGMLFSSDKSHQIASKASAASASQNTNQTQYEEGLWGWLTHDATGVFTLLLCFIVGYQAYLFIRQLKSINEGLGPATETAKAALISAEATKDAVLLQQQQFLATNRPKIRIKHVFLADDLWHDKPLVVCVSCVNNGTTEARIFGYGAKIFLLKQGANIPFPKHGIQPFIKDAAYLVDCGTVYELPHIEDGTILSDLDHVAIRKGVKQLYCAGYVHYVDKAERKRTTGFCRVLTLPENASVNDRGRFRVVDDPDLEYED